MGTINTVQAVGRPDHIVPDQCPVHIYAELCAMS
jgi:hypothetical protein